MFTSRAAGRRHAGMTLIELIMFIVVVSVGLAGILSVLTVATRGSADPMVRKHLLAIGEALLEEIQLMPFTFCDPTDDNAATATSATVGAGGCASTVEQTGPEASQTRNGSAEPFNNVNDYGVASGPPLTLGSPIVDLSNTRFAPAGYSASIQVVPEALNGIGATEVLRIAVTVTRGAESLTLEGYRTRHSPNWVP